MTKALVTGAGGFIGSHLVEQLLDEGIQVKALVHYNALNARGWLDTLPPAVLDEVEIIAGDVRDFHGLRTAARGVDWVFHLAALIGIPYSYHAPDSYVATNITGTLNVLQAAREASVSRVLITSTSEVYGTAQYIPMDEQHPKQGQSPYAATKIGADALAESFYRSFGLPITLVRPFNTYGPRQSARAVIPTILTQLLNGHDTLALGILHPTRDWVFVQDTVRAFVAIAQATTLVGEAVNIASQTEISVATMAEKLIELINPAARIQREPGRTRPEASEVERLCGSNEKLQRHTGWRPQYSLDAGLQRTIAWFREAANLRRYQAPGYHV